MLKARLSFFLDPPGLQISDVIRRWQNCRATHVVGHCCLDDRMIEVSHPRVRPVTMDFYAGRARLTLAREVTEEQAQKIDERLVSLIGLGYDTGRLGAVGTSDVASPDLAEHMLLENEGEAICIDSALPAMQVLDGPKVVPHPMLADVGDVLWVCLLSNGLWWIDSSSGLDVVRRQMAAFEVHCQDGEA